MNVFISHSSADAEQAGKVCTLLEEAGHQCFIAPRDIHTGKEYAEELILGIERSDVLVLMLSNRSNRSPHVLREIEHAASRSIPIVVYKMEEVTLTKSMEYFLMTHQWMNQKADTDYSAIVKCIDHLQSDLKGASESQKMPVSDTKEIPVSDTSVQNRRKHPTAGKAPIWRAAAFVAAVAVVVGIVLSCSILIPSITRAENREQQVRSDSIDLADTVTLGSYNGEPITWKVIYLSEDGSQAVLLTEHIITMKAYDAAGSTRFNFDNGIDYWRYASEDFEDKALEAKVRGNNDWNSSNIRTWLNSDRQNVDYGENPPISSAMSELKNGYDHEAGFLSGFTEEEKAVLLQAEVETKSNMLLQENSQTTLDRIFLLSMEELDWLTEADVSIFAAPTEAAVRQDSTGWYQAYSLDYGTKNYFWWLREPKEGSASQCYTIANGLTADHMTTQIVGTEGFGIRPAAFVDVKALINLMSEQNL